MKIALLGDISLNGIYDRTVSDEVYRRVQCIKEQVKDCDYVIGNLESPLTANEKNQACKGAYLKSDPVNIEILKYIGVTHVTLANNHVFDYGTKGAADTVETLNRANIKYVGLCNDAELITKGEDRVLLDGFCCLSANGVRYGSTSGKIQLLTYESLAQFLDKAGDKQCMPIASIHFGIERLHYPSVEHVKMFRELTKKTPYILHGNHPHAIQGYEIYQKSALFYAQGNLFFGDVETTSTHGCVKQTSESRKNYIVKLNIIGKELFDYEIIPLSASRDGILHKDSEVGKELRKYSQKLSGPIEELRKERASEIQGRKNSAEKRNMKFILNRLNYKYICAYINGQIHEWKYGKIIKKFDS